MSQSAVLARRFQQNWMDRHPHDTCHSGLNLDDSLTSLGWLQNLKVSEFTQPRQKSIACVRIDSNRNFIQEEYSMAPTSFTLLQDTNQNHGFQTVVPVQVYSSSSVITDHKTNPYVKPPYSYASLICMAMKSTKKNKITLSSIYSWITDNFMYYRLSDPSWQNSIRHNLSLNKCFEKVARRKDEPGKGGFWRINPQYSDMIEKEVFRKRRGSRDTIPSPCFKHLKLEDDDIFGVSEIRNGTGEDKMLSNCSDAFGTNDEDSENSLTLKGDLNWTAVMNQDIEIGGKFIKTEDVLDECENSPYLTLSPPSSETNSDDLGLDFLSQTGFGIHLPLDLQTNDPLDLTVQGTTIRPPDWWTADDNNNIVNVRVNVRENSGLNTPVPPSPEPEQGDIIWGENLKLGSSGSNFDLESLFAFDRMTSPKQLE